MKIYTVWGDYGYTNEMELFSTVNLKDAKDFAYEFTENGYFGEYNTIEVAWFSDTGEYMTELVLRAEDFGPGDYDYDDGVDYFDFDDEPEWDYFSD